MSCRPVKFLLMFRKGRWCLRYSPTRPTSCWWTSKSSAELSVSSLARCHWEKTSRPTELVVFTKDDRVSYVRRYGSQKERDRRMAVDRATFQLPPLKDTDPSRVRGHLRSQNIGWNAAVAEFDRIISRRCT